MQMLDLSLKERNETCLNEPILQKKKIRLSRKPSTGHFRDLILEKTPARFFQDRRQPKISNEVKKLTIPLLEEISLEEVMSELNLPMSCLGLGSGEDDHQRTQEFWTNIGIYR